MLDIDHAFILRHLIEHGRRRLHGPVTRRHAVLGIAKAYH